MNYLLDTNIVSEFRKGNRCDKGVAGWISEADEQSLFLSVLVVGEIRKGIESLRRRDGAQAEAIDFWLQRLVRDYADRILPIDQTIAEIWGRLSVPDPRPVVDALIAATALAHGMTLVTRNEPDYAATGVAVVNPFAV